MDLIWQEMSGIPFFGNPKIWSVRSHVAKGSQSRCCLVWFEEIQPLNLATCLEGKQWCSTGGQRLHLELDLQLNITSIYVYLYFARYLKKVSPPFSPSANSPMEHRSECRQVLPEEFGIRICEIEAYADLQNNNRLEEGNFVSWYDGEVSCPLHDSTLKGQWNDTTSLFTREVLARRASFSACRRLGILNPKRLHSDQTRKSKTHHFEMVLLCKVGYTLSVLPNKRVCMTGGFLNLSRVQI